MQSSCNSYPCCLVWTKQLSVTIKCPLLTSNCLLILLLRLSNSHQDMVTFFIKGKWWKERRWTHFKNEWVYSIRKKVLYSFPRTPGFCVSIFIRMGWFVLGYYCLLLLEILEKGGKQRILSICLKRNQWNKLILRRLQWHSNPSLRGAFVHQIREERKES